MKIGAAESTVISALARAIVYTPPNKPGVKNQKKSLGSDLFIEKVNEVELAIKESICQYPNYTAIIDTLL